MKFTEEDSNYNIEEHLKYKIRNKASSNPKTDSYRVDLDECELNYLLKCIEHKEYDDVLLKDALYCVSGLLKAAINYDISKDEFKNIEKLYVAIKRRLMFKENRGMFYDSNGEEIGTIGEQ